MTKLSRSLALAALLAGAATLNVAPAQDKGKPTKKEDDKKSKGKKAAGSVEVLENKAGKFYFKIVNADGKMLAMSPVGGFAEKEEAVKAVEELKDILEVAKITYPPKKADKDDDDKMEKKEKDKKDPKKDGKKKDKDGGAE